MDNTANPIKPTNLAVKLNELPIKPREKSKEKLDDNHRMLILRMRAEGFTAKETQEQLKDQFNVSVHEQTIRTSCVAPQNQSYLKQFRDNYLARVKDVPIANKRFRLDDMEKIRKQLIMFLDDVDKTTKNGRTEYRELTGCLLKIIESAREEMERKPQLVNNTLVNFQEISDDQLIERKRHLIKRLEQLNGGGTSRTDPDTRISESEDTGEPS